MERMNGGDVDKKLKKARKMQDKSCISQHFHFEIKNLHEHQ